MTRPPVTPPVALKRRMAAVLVDLRKETGLTLEVAAKRVKLTKSSLSRFENAHTAPKIHAMQALMALYNADADTRAEMERLAEEASRRGWKASLFGEGVSVPDWFSSYVGLERTATSLSIYHYLVPGLLQTGDYARIVIAAGGRSDQELERRVELRGVRQAHIRDGGPTVHVVLDEGVMHRQVGDRDVMSGQMRRLLELGSLPNVTIQVLPFGRGSATAAVGAPFVLLGSDGHGPPIAYLEHYEISHFIEDAANVAAFTLAFQQLSAAALSADETAQLLADASKEG